MAEARDTLAARSPVDGIVAFVRDEPGSVAIALMAIAGLAISIYLTTVHYAAVPLVCTNTGTLDCSAVTTSSYSVVPRTNLPITIPGMLWFIVSGGLATSALVLHRQQRPEPERLRLLQLLWGGAGLAFVLYLVYAEIVLIRHICEWCTVVHVLTLAIFLVALYRFQQAVVPAPAPRRTQAANPTAPRPEARTPQRSPQRPRSRRR
ncbi:MAG TPA: vitamin K epoxide reductase family protein [Ktedonobacterales bacterium]|jgi:uncharacterized membrane protein|nr:vitamin K epoxide reductase family protein [Ktedonobacterales bacterium]